MQNNASRTETNPAVEFSFTGSKRAAVQQTSSVYLGQSGWLTFFDGHFKKHYSEDFGRPALPVRLMVSLLILKHIRNLSDEGIIEQWAENAYYHYFSGAEFFTPSPPCEASELVHFRNRSGAEGIELNFEGEHSHQW